MLKCVKSGKLIDVYGGVETVFNGFRQIDSFDTVLTGFGRNGSQARVNKHWKTLENRVNLPQKRVK